MTRKERIRENERIEKKAADVAVDLRVTQERITMASDVFKQEK